MAFNIHYDTIKVAGATTSQTSPDYKNEWGCGARIFVNMTNVGTGSVTLTFQGKDPTSGQYYNILVGAPIVSNTFTQYSIFPGAAAVANSSVNDIVPLTWRIIMTANNANPTTYSVGVSLIG